MTRFIRHFSRFLAYIFAVFAVLLTFGIWHLSSVNLSSKNWTPYIETVFEQIVPDSNATISRSSVNWDNDNFTLSLLCDEIKLFDAQNQIVMFFPKASLKINIWSLLRGHFLPEEFLADKAEFWIQRHKNNELTLGAIKQNEISGNKEAVKKDNNFVDLFALLQNIGDELANDSFNHKIKIKNLSVNLYDEKTIRRWQFKIPELNLNHKGNNVVGTARLTLNKNQKETSSIQLTYHYEYENKLHNMGVSFQDIRLSSFSFFAPDLNILKMVDLPVSGAFSVRTDRNLNISTTSLILKGKTGVIFAPNLWNKPLLISNANLDAKYNEDKGKLDVTANNIGFGKSKLSAKFNANITKKFKQFWLQKRDDNNKFVFNLDVENVSMNSIGDIWPKTIIPNARSWIVKNMKNGMFDKASVVASGHININELKKSKLEKVEGKIKVSNGRLTYLDGMPAIDEVSANADFDLDNMYVHIEKGHTGEILIQPFTLHIADFQKDIQKINIPIKLIGSVTDVLTLIDSPRLGYATAIGLNPNESMGMVDGTLTLSMPLLNDLLLEDININADAHITSFACATLVPHIGITKGDMQLSLNVNGLNLKGSLYLNDVFAKINWDTIFNETKAKEKNIPINKAIITASLKDNQFDRFYGLGRYLKVKGTVPVTVDYKNFDKGYNVISVNALLDDADFNLDQFAVHKKKNNKANASFIFETKDGEPNLFKDIIVKGKGINIKGNAVMDSDTSDLTSVYLSPFIIGRHNAKVFYELPVDKTKTMILKITGKSFDTNGFGDNPSEIGSKNEKSKNKIVENDNNSFLQPKIISIKLKKLYTSEDGFIDNVKYEAKRSSLGWENLFFTGMAQGKTALKAILSKNKKGYKDFKVTSDDFGVMMKGAGFGDVVNGGKLSIVAQSTKKHPYDVKGKVKLSSFTIKDWPFLARLFNALSPFGYIDLVTGDASFNHLRGYFVWGRHSIKLNDINAAGSVVGLNIKGNINTDNDNIAINGTAVPFSFVNKIIGSIPLIGDVITGGKGQGVIAASFNVTGKLSNPKISVNPVSLLTPGFLRNIFFSSEEDNKKSKKSDYPNNTK